MELGSTDGELLQIHSIVSCRNKLVHLIVPFFRILNTSVAFLGRDLDIISTGNGVNFLPVYVQIPILHTDSDLAAFFNFQKSAKLLIFSL